MTPVSKALLFLALTACALKPGRGDDYAPIFHMCNTARYAHGSATEASVSALLGALNNGSASPGGFAAASAGAGGDSPVYGVAQCRGDVASGSCRRCVVRAAVRALDVCAGAVGARVQLELCRLRYERYDFRGKLDTSVLLVLVNVNSVAQYAAATWNAAVRALLASLSQTAAANHGWGVGSVGAPPGVGVGGSLYGMATCRKDLTDADCATCLGRALDGIGKYAGARVGAQIFVEGCYLRYETYLFYSSGN